MKRCKAGYRKKMFAGMPACVDSKGRPEGSTRYQSNKKVVTVNTGQTTVKRVVRKESPEQIEDWFNENPLRASGPSASFYAQFGGKPMNPPKYRIRKRT
jgi:hypothetical protein